MRVLVLGGAGLLGTYLVPALVSLGHVVGICDNMTQHNKYRLLDSVYLFTSNVTDVNSTRQAFNKFKPEVVVVAVAHTFTKDVLYSFSEDTQLVFDSANTVAELINPQVKHVVFCSSSEVYGAPQPTKPLKETRRISFTATHHGAAKLGAESLLRFRCKELGIKFSILRIFDMYGPRKVFCARTGIINFLISTFEDNRNTVGLQGANKLKDFIHAADVAECVAVVVDKAIEGVYNVGTGKGTTLIELVKMIATLMPIRTPPVIVPDGNITSYSAVADTSALLGVIPDWSPAVIETSALKELIESREMLSLPMEDKLAKFKESRGL